MNRRALAVYATLFAAWGLILGWQIAEHLRVRKSARTGDKEAVLELGVLERLQAADEQRRFRLAMDHSGDMMVLVDRETMRFVDVNDTLCRQVGYRREELLGMPVERLVAAPREELGEWRRLERSPAGGRLPLELRPHPEPPHQRVRLPGHAGCFLRPGVRLDLGQPRTVGNRRLAGLNAT